MPASSKSSCGSLDLEEQKPMSDYLPAPRPDGERLPAAAENGLQPRSAEPFAHFAAPDDEEEGGADLGRYLAAVLRHKWAILLLVIVGAGVGVFLADRVRPEYVAQATVWIQVSERGEAATGPIRSGELLQSSAWVDLLRSYIVLDHVVRDQRLYLNYGEPADSSLFANFVLAESFRPGTYELVVSPDGSGYQLETDGGLVVERGAPGDSIGADVGFVWAPAAERLGRDRTISFSVLTPREASIRLSDDLRTQLPGQNGNFLRLSLAGADPNRIAATLNTLTDRYVEVATELKRGKLDELTSILEEQLDYAEQRLHEAEMALEAFRVQTITLPSESSTPVTPGLAQTQDPVFSRFFDMKIEREQIQRDREAVREALAALEADQQGATERLWAVNAVQQSAQLLQTLEELTEKEAELRVLRNQYTDQHVEVQQLAGEVATLEHVAIPRAARALLNQLNEREATLTALIGSASGELQEIPPRMIEEARLRRQMNGAERLFADIQGRYEAARLAAVSSIPDVRVLDEATVPFRPTNPDAKPRIILMAILGGLGLGIGGAILRDRMDKRVRYPDQITDEIGLPILGAVPLAPMGRKADDEKAEQVVEAFRELRLSLMHAHGAAGPVVLTVTSPGSGDGKSFVSSNLALSFADLQQRVLLIDGDIRRGTLHSLLERDRKPGLTDYLAGAVSEDGLIQSTDYENVDFIGSGTWRRSGPELLGSPAMRELIATMRGRYGVIIVDSSPLGAGADPYVLGTMTGNLVMVLRTGTTDRELAGTKLDMMHRLPVRILGAIMNAVPARGAYRYYSYFSNYQVPQLEREVESGVGV